MCQSVGACVARVANDGADKNAFPDRNFKLQRLISAYCLDYILMQCRLFWDLSVLFVHLEHTGGSCSLKFSMLLVMCSSGQISWVRVVSSSCSRAKCLDCGCPEDG